MGPDASESSVARTTCPTPGSDERIAASRGVRGFPDEGSSLAAEAFSLSAEGSLLLEGGSSLSESLSRMAAMAHWAPLICFATNSSRSARYRT